jgi:hypothetical protein
MFIKSDMRCVAQIYKSGTVHTSYSFFKNKGTEQHYLFIPVEVKNYFESRGYGWLTEGICSAVRVQKIDIVVDRVGFLCRGADRRTEGIMYDGLLAHSSIWSV